jgi:hypothetical protein
MPGDVLRVCALVGTVVYVTVPEFSVLNNNPYTGPMLALYHCNALRPGSASRPPF